MTSRERLLSAIHLEKPDRVPVSPLGLGRSGNMADELLAKTDPIIKAGIGGNATLGKNVKSESEQIGNETITSIHTPKGDLVRKTKSTGITSATVEFPFKTREDVEKFLSLPYQPPDVNVDGFLAQKERIGQEGLVMAGIGDAVCLPASWFSPEDFCLQWADDADLLKLLVEVAAERLHPFIEKACQLGVDAFWIAGGEYVTVQLGPEAFEILIKPYDRELVDIIHKYGGIAHYHNHGKVARFLENFVDLDLDIIAPLEAPPCGDIDLADAKSRIGDKMCLMGNIDDMMVLSSADIDEVKEIGRICIESAGTSGYILGGTDSGTFNEKAAQNFIALVDVAREYQ